MQRKPAKAALCKLLLKYFQDTQDIYGGVFSLPKFLQYKKKQFTMKKLKLKFTLSFDVMTRHSN